MTASLPKQLTFYFTALLLTLPFTLTHLSDYPLANLPLSPSALYHLQLDNTSIPISDSVKNLGVILDSSLSMTTFVSATARACYFHLRRISQIRKCLTTEATAKLIVSLILSRIDYCNSLLSGLPDSTIYTLQRVQNNAARFIL